ncbi:MAG: DUF1858 domain-containing protein [Caldithrix sp.]|nr:DUF1858 domain-containing protein [Caldithrix sp.]
MYIDGNMEIEDIIEEYPQLIKPMQKLGVQCMVCGEPVWGTLAEKVDEKGLDLEEILTRLNAVLKTEND